jgi:hypothetical protein
MIFDEPNDVDFDGLSNVLMFDDFFSAPAQPAPIKSQLNKTVKQINTWIGIEPPVVLVTLPGIDPLIS